MTEDQENHCIDCCCARSWKALGIYTYTGKSIPEHIAQLKERDGHLKYMLERIVNSDNPAALARAVLDEYWK